MPPESPGVASGTVPPSKKRKSQVDDEASSDKRRKQDDDVRDVAMSGTATEATIETYEAPYISGAFYRRQYAPRGTEASGSGRIRSHQGYSTTGSSWGQGFRGCRSPATRASQQGTNTGTYSRDWTWPGSVNMGTSQD